MSPLLIGAIIAFFIALWVFQDAQKRYQNKNKDWTALLWFFAVWGLLIIFLPLYLILRPKPPKEIKVTELPSIKIEESKLCIHCGKYYQGNPSFCPNCGHQLKVEQK